MIHMGPTWEGAGGALLRAADPPFYIVERGNGQLHLESAGIGDCTGLKILEANGRRAQVSVVVFENFKQSDLCIKERYRKFADDVVRLLLVSVTDDVPRFLVFENTSSGFRAIDRVLRQL